MHPEPKIIELRELARGARDYQLERGWSDATLCREISSLGSTKTFKRILDVDDDLSEGMSIDNQLKAYREARELIQLKRIEDNVPEVEWADFANVINVKSAVVKALAEDATTSISRLVLVLGENGTGKDVAKNAILKDWGTIAVSIDANTHWADSLAYPTEKILSALNIRRQADKATGESFVLPRFPAQRSDLIVGELKKRKLILMINEAHHMGLRMWLDIKRYINETPVVPVLLGHPSLLKKFISLQWEETSQLVGNRLRGVVHLPTPQPNEILLMLERRGVTFADVTTSNAAAKTISTEATLFGNWAFVKMVARTARQIGKGAPLDSKKISEAISRVKEERLINQRLQQQGA